MLLKLIRMFFGVLLWIVVEIIGKFEGFYKGC